MCREPPLPGNLPSRPLLTALLIGPTGVGKTETAKGWIVDRGYDPRFGARPLRRAIERYLVDPLSQFIASSDLVAGDIVEVEIEREGLAFFRRERSKEERIA